MACFRCVPTVRTLFISPPEAESAFKISSPDIMILQRSSSYLAGLT